ncbi:hypothetical protein GUJ93_ZPchr0007g5572 [Zizania palustris]|uniref:Uncharacterized protein n=1 Tax=Zizania palustris TaxID=103762 RepID=A0A8J5VMS2_ZIZPA|nr:hypothetical protein GUJ93_ZPchr0007g5572 [Zizania palustris]
MEGDEIFASIDSLWFYSTVFLPPSPKRKNCSAVSGELQPRKQDSTESRRMDGDCGSQDTGCVREAAPVAASRRAAATIRELEERMDIWQEQHWRQTRVAAPARCSPSSMPPPGDGPAMKAHLRSWAHAVACSVR